MELGVPRQHPQEHDAVAAHFDDLGHSWVGAVIAHDDEVTLLDVRTGCDVVDVGMRQARRVDSVEVDPQIPRGCLVPGHERSL